MPRVRHSKRSAPPRCAPSFETRNSQSTDQRTSFELNFSTPIDPAESDESIAKPAPDAKWINGWRAPPCVPRRKRKDRASGCGEDDQDEVSENPYSDGSGHGLSLSESPTLPDMPLSPAPNEDNEIRRAEKYASQVRLDYEIDGPSDFKRYSKQKARKQQVEQPPLQEPPRCRLEGSPVYNIRTEDELEDVTPWTLEDRFVGIPESIDGFMPSLSIQDQKRGVRPRVLDPFPGLPTAKRVCHFFKTTAVDQATPPPKGNPRHQDPPT